MSQKAFQLTCCSSLGFGVNVPAALGLLNGHVSIASRERDSLHTQQVSRLEY